jgi:ribonuclease Z
MHPVMGRTESGMPPEVFNRQSLTTDLGAMAQRVKAKHLILTHLGPSIGAAVQGAYKVPGGPLSAADFRKAAEAGGFTGNIVVGPDLTSLRLPAK